MGQVPGHCAKFVEGSPGSRGGVKIPLRLSVNTSRIPLGHESLDITLAYLKGKDAESEEAQEHTNSSSLALYA